MRNAKIVCTLGPASGSPDAVADLIDAGMSVARINASHGDPADIKPYFETVRSVAAERSEPIATVLDLQGPEIRTAPTDGTTMLQDGETVRFVPDAETRDGTIGLSRSIAAVKPDDFVLLDDGLIECRVTETDGETVTAIVESGGELGSRKGVNVPGVDLDLEMVTEKDRADLELVDTGLVDFVAASLVRDAEDVYEVNAVIEELGASVPMIAKIERADAVENMDGIVEAAYGVMVARGDLGVECPMEDVPLMQKRIIRRCHRAGVPVITATEMLDSMVDSPRPTRAEASDVANAVLDGTDAVMLSAETAVGSDPVHVVETMDRIVREVEASEEYEEVREQRVPVDTGSRTDALARSGRYLARDLDASAIIAASESGFTALRVAKYRPGVPVVAVTLSETVHRRLAVSWGVQPYLATVEDPEATAVIDDAVMSTIATGTADSGDTLVVITGMMHEIEGAELTNTLKLHVAAETLTIGRVVVPGRVSGPLYESIDGELDDVPDGAIVSLPASFDAEFSGDLSRIGGFVVDAPGLTGYPAMVARELDIPMISDAAVDPTAVDGDRVTLDAERGVLYDGDISTPSLLAERADSPYG